MNYILTPQEIINRANQMTGVAEMMTENNVDRADQVTIATDVAEELVDWWNEGDGFGSSDATYAVKDYLDTIIRMVGINYQTAWINNRLGVEVK